MSACKTANATNLDNVIAFNISLSATRRGKFWTWSKAKYFNISFTILKLFAHQIPLSWLLILQNKKWPNSKSVFALIIYAACKKWHNFQHLRLSFHGSTWQTRRRKRGKATRPDSVVFEFRISILSAEASMEIRRGGHAFRVPILSSNEYWWAHSIILPACRQTDYERQECVNLKRRVRRVFIYVICCKYTVATINMCKVLLRKKLNNHLIESILKTSYCDK